MNGDLKPHTAYELSNGHTYITDASGRVSAVEGKLDLSRMDRNTYQQCKVGHCGNLGDDGGHLIASSLGGTGDKINMVPQASTLNQGDWKAMENSLRKDLEAGKSVQHGKGDRFEWHLLNPLWMTASLNSRASRLACSS